MKPIQVDRPHMPGYGLLAPHEGAGLLPWPDVSAQLAAARNYWLATTRPDGRPHATPVWGVWMDDVFYFGAGARSQKARNLGVQPWLALHLESGDDVVIVEGPVARVTDPDLLARVFVLYAAKYEWQPPAAEDNSPPADPFFALQPHVALTWREHDFPGSATRYRFASS